jgi:hypothetical protein
MDAAGVNRRLIIDAAAGLAETSRYAEFRGDLEDIASRAEVLPV